MKGLELFVGRVLGVATQHGKEAVIGPAMQQALGLLSFQAIEGLDTDRFGAFSGEVVRTLDPYQAALAKAREGARLSGLDLVVASEGSFGPYPPAPFMSCDEEHLVLFDARTEAVYAHRYVSLSTMHGGEECKDLQAVEAFAKRMGFPAHGIIIKHSQHQGPLELVVKGIRQRALLVEHAGRTLQDHGSCWVETDLRAMMNPTRMAVIEEATQAFVEQLSTCCPACHACWFRIAETRDGLPCAGCGWPTRSIRAYVRKCGQCGHEQHSPRPDGKLAEDPGACENCNP